VEKPLRTLQHDAGMLLVCLIWGLNFTITKAAFHRLSPLAFTAIRYALACALLVGVVRLVEGPDGRPRGALFWRLVWMGFLGNTLYQITFVFGLDRSTATNSSLILSSSPAVVAVLAALLGFERATARTALGIACGIAGVAVIVLARPGVGHAVRSGDLFTVAAVLMWSIYTVGLRRVESLSPLRITAWTTYTGTPGIIAAGIPDLLRVDFRTVDWKVWGAIGYAAALSLVVGYLLWNRSVRAVGETRTAIYMCVTPLFAVLIAWAVLGERPSPWHALGGALVAAGVIMTRLGATPSLLALTRGR